MTRNIIVLGGSSHPTLTQAICENLGVLPAKIFLGKFAVGETRVEIEESVRGKDVFIIQSGGGGKVNDHLLELLITISACKIASASRVTAVLPLFPYSRQHDLPYQKLTGNPPKISNISTRSSTEQSDRSNSAPETTNCEFRSAHSTSPVLSSGSTTSKADNADIFSPDKAASSHTNSLPAFTPQPGYKQWVAQAGSLVAELLSCAGADHVITMDLHDAQYQGFFDIPVDNLYARNLMKTYIKYNIPNYKDAIIVSPDAGGAKRATDIADSLGIRFALIHKERRPTQITIRQHSTMMLVGDVAGRTAILIDDMIDTAKTITRAAKLLKNEGATAVYALVTHGLMSGNATQLLNASALDRIVVTNSVDQTVHSQRCPKIKVMDVGVMFAETIRRVHHGESISALFNNL